MFGVGIIGTGWGIKVQVHAFRESGWKVVALCGRDPEKTKKLGEESGIPFTTVSMEELINHKDVNLVLVTVPPHLHSSISIMALEAGKHVVCDKPVALNTDEVKKMISVASSHRNQLALVDFELRQLSSYQEAKKQIDEKKNWVRYTAFLQTFSHIAFLLALSVGGMKKIKVEDYLELLEVILLI